VWLELVARAKKLILELEPERVICRARTALLERCRNIGIMATSMPADHYGPRHLFLHGRTHRIGEVHEGTATMD